MPTTIHPFQSEHGFTGFSNYVLDYIMPDLPANAWKVLSFIIRKTEGWNKEKDNLSLSQIMAGTGIKNRTTASVAIKELEDKNYINVHRPNDKVTSNTYSINTELTIEIPSTENGLASPESVPPPSTETVPASTEIVPGVVQKSDTQKKLLNTTPNGVSDKSPPAKKTGKGRKPLRQLMGVFQTETGLKMPHKKNIEGFWWSNISEIYNIADENYERADQLIRQSVEKLRGAKLTIGGPESILKTCRAIAAETNGRRAILK